MMNDSFVAELSPPLAERVSQRAIDLQINGKVKNEIILPIGFFI